MRTSQIFKQLGILDTATNLTAGHPRNAAKNNPKTAVMTAEEDNEPTEKTLEHTPTVSVLSKQQAFQLLNSGRKQAKRSKGATPRPKSALEDSLHGKFVNLGDLLLPVPAKGEFDVKKIKSSLYFFS